LLRDCLALLSMPVYLIPGHHPFRLDPDYPAFDDKDSVPATHS